MHGWGSHISRTREAELWQTYPEKRSPRSSSHRVARKAAGRRWKESLRAMVASVVRAVKLRDRVALLTGTSPNICGGIALGMAEAGARIVCADVQADHAHRCADD